jgi:uncharacterized protein (TIGR02246 family)
VEENAMRNRFHLVLGGGLFLTLAIGLPLAGDQLARQAQAREEPRNTDRKADQDALRKLTEALEGAVDKEDARALASLWTEEGEYVGEHGVTIRGRSAIEKAYGLAFGKNHRTKLQLHVDSIRFVARDSAIIEGRAQSQRGKADQPTSSRFSVLCARENGTWLIALLREWPDEGITMSDMEWLIGTWTAKTEGGEVRTTYEWDESKKFIHCRFSIKVLDDTLAGTQYIGRDPRTGNLRSWLFENDGGFGEAEWTWDGKRWLQAATGVQADGDEVTATNILTPIDKDSFIWQSIDRTENDEDVPNIPPVKVTRVK